MMRAPLAALLLAAVAACSAEEGDAAMENPDAFACRQRAIALLGVPFAGTSARRTGPSVYEVTAEGRIFRCTLDERRMIAAYEPVG